MTVAGETYLAIVLAAFLTYTGVLFWAMLSTRDLPPDPRHHQPGD
ncbi:MAG TPA: hypothetical protein VGL83_04770 [Stellaceae bacterium]|jgi:hypothetical protein